MAKKILVIDDEVHTLEMIASRLKANEFEVITALNGDEGMEKCKEETPDLIILDVMMPVMDGFGFIKIIKTDPDPDLSDIPILVLTARGAMKDTFEAMRADAFLEKPYESDELVSTVQYILDKRALLFCDDPFVLEKATDRLKRHRYEICVVRDEGDILKKMEEDTYRLIIVHLPGLSMAPEDLAGKVSMLRPRPPRLIVYSDSRVKGTEDGSGAAIKELKEKWEKAGADVFFDARIAEETFKDLLERLS